LIHHIKIRQIKLRGKEKRKTALSFEPSALSQPDRRNQTGSTSASGRPFIRSAIRHPADDKEKGDQSILINYEQEKSDIITSAIFLLLLATLLH
jgi:hypothetical protein